MRKSIFDIENRIDITNEYKKMLNALYEKSTVCYKSRLMSLHEFIDEYVFNLWDDRDTFTDFDEYCRHIGLASYGSFSEEVFLNFIEMIVNLNLVIDEYYPDLKYTSLKTQNIFKHNIPIILEKMNYKVETINNRKIIIKRDADVDSVLEIVPIKIAEVLLQYNDIRNNNVDAKKTLLKELDLYLESDENKKIFKSLDSKLWDSIGTIVNKMGVNHNINEEPYSLLSEDDIVSWYDKCFKMMIHLIREKEINEIKKERTKLVQQEGGSNA